jgi:hypothetical protein
LHSVPRRTIQDSLWPLYVTTSHTCTTQRPEYGGLWDISICHPAISQLPSGLFSIGRHAGKSPGCRLRDWRSYLAGQESYVRGAGSYPRRRSAGRETFGQKRPCILVGLPTSRPSAASSSPPLSSSGGIARHKLVHQPTHRCRSGDAAKRLGHWCCGAPLRGPCTDQGHRSTI